MREPNGVIKLVVADGATKTYEISANLKLQFGPFIGSLEVENYTDIYSAPFKKNSECRAPMQIRV